MKHEGFSAIAESKVGTAFLVCAIPEAGVQAENEEGIVTSPLRCLDEACDGKFSHILVCFSQKTFRDTDDLVELCRSLKHNSRTKKIPLLAVLRKRNEGLMKVLEKTGAEYVKILEGPRLDREVLREIVSGLGPDDLLERQVLSYCPYLNFSRVNESLDMPVCGAYHNILVINDRRLRSLCSVECHEDCEYFKNPRKNR